MKAALIRLGVLFALLALLASCTTVDVSPTPVSPLPTPTYTPGPAPTGRAVDASVAADIPAPELVMGTPATWDEYERMFGRQAETLMSALGVTAAADPAGECNELPLVYDVRANDDPSLSVLPRLGQDEYLRLKGFYKFEERYEHGCERAQPGQRYWDLHAVEFKCGPAILQPQALNTDGTKAEGILMLLNWPGAPEFPSHVDPPYTQSGVTCWTDGGGSCGWGYGGESHIGPDGGPYLTWPHRDPVEWTDGRVGADGFDKVGWWDNHCTPNPMYKDRRKAGDPQPVDGWLLIDLDENGQQVGYIPFQTGVIPVDQRLLILRSPEGVDVGFVPWKQE